MIRFDYINGLLQLRAIVRQVDRKAELRFIIDTGAAGSALDFNVIKPDYARHSRFVRISGVGGQESVLVQRLDLLDISFASPH